MEDQQIWSRCAEIRRLRAATTSCWALSTSSTVQAGRRGATARWFRTPHLLLARRHAPARSTPAAPARSIMPEPSRLRHAIGRPAPKLNEGVALTPAMPRRQGSGLRPARSGTSDCAAIRPGSPPLPPLTLRHPFRHAHEGGSDVPVIDASKGA